MILHFIIILLDCILLALACIIGQLCNQAQATPGSVFVLQSQGLATCVTAPSFFVLYSFLQFTPTEFFYNYDTDPIWNNFK